MPATKENLITLGKKMARGRSFYDVSLRELARVLEVSPSYLSRLENGQDTPSQRILEEYSWRFCLDLDEMSRLASRIPRDIQISLVSNPIAFRMVREVLAHG